MSNFTIRTLRGSDLKPVVALWNRALKRDPMNEARFVRQVFADGDFLQGDDSGFFIAERAGEIVGFLRCILRYWPNDRMGTEPENAWIPVMGVDPACQRQGIGQALLDAAIAHCKRHGRKHIWVCGNTGSAPGYIFPGVDKDAYAGALALFLKNGFVVDHEPVAMSCAVTDFDLETHTRLAWETGKDVVIETLSPERVPDFFSWLSKAFPGDWNIVARAKVKAGGMGDMLIAIVEGRIVGYCQWDADHFGPFGVDATARNRKVGGKLFLEALRRMRQADGRFVWFNWADPDAARFYERIGFKATRRYAILRKDF